MKRGRQSSCMPLQPTRGFVNYVHHYSYFNLILAIVNVHIKRENGKHLDWMDLANELNYTSIVCLAWAAGRTD